MHIPLGRRLLSTDAQTRISAECTIDRQPGSGELIEASAFPTLCLAPIYAPLRRLYALLGCAIKRSAGM